MCVYVCVWAREESLDYVQAGAVAVGGPGDAADTSLVIFCIDISGSMCVTSEMEGKIALRYASSVLCVRVCVCARVCASL